MDYLNNRRLAARAAAAGGTLLAASGALQASGLHWTENAVKTPAQHVTMALFAAALVLLVPAVAHLAQSAGRRARLAWVAIALGQIGVAAASSVSNVRGIDASWFPAVAVAANVLWILGTLTLTVGLYRSRQVPRLLAVGLFVAYVGSIPLSILGGGIVAGAYWLAVAYVLGAGDRPLLVQPSTTL